MQPDRRDRDITALRDMLAAMRMAASHAGGLHKEAAGQSPHLRDACLYRVLVLGEAATRVSEGLKSQYSGIPWSDIVGMRNVLIHGYEKVNWNVIWDAVHNDFPQLESQVQSVLDDLE